MIVILRREYGGFESIADLDRDVYEAIEGADIPGEFQGTMTVTITYEPGEDE